MVAALQLSVVIPAFNEEARLPGTLDALQPYLAGLGIDYELILVDDGSRDGTLRLMREAADASPRVRVISLPRNRGKGRALATGAEASRGQLLLITDADMSTPIAELPKLEQAIEAGAGVAIASRARPGARILVAQPPHRVLMGKLFNACVQLLLLPGLWDTQCGFKLLRGAVGRQIFAELVTDGFAFDVEILCRARQAGWEIAEVPVEWASSAPTKVAPIRDPLLMLRDLLRIRSAVTRGRRLHERPDEEPVGEPRHRRIG